MVYTVKRGDTLSKISTRHGVTLAALLAANPRYKANPNAVGVGETLEIPGKKAGPRKTTKKKPGPLSPVDPTAIDEGDDFQVAFGQLTFDAEGMEKPGRFSAATYMYPVLGPGPPSAVAMTCENVPETR